MKYLLHADGSLPNLALMRLSTYFQSRGESVHFLRHPLEYSPKYDAKPTGVYGSSIFQKSSEIRAHFERVLGPVIWGGTGVRVESSLAEIDADVDWDSVRPDYSLYPEFTGSIGFLTRGCRLRCGFCVVPTKEGKPRIASTIRGIWRGDPHPMHLELLDNDAFAPALRDHWREAVREIREEGYRVCFSQGINLRLVDDEAAAMLASITYTGHDFSLKTRRLYTAWDNLGDEDVFKRGIDTLRRAGIPSSRLVVYMLIGYDSRETWEMIFYRFRELVALGCDPYPMVFDRPARPDLCAFDRYVKLRLYRQGTPWSEYERLRLLTPEARDGSLGAWARVIAGWRPKQRLAVSA